MKEEQIIELIKSRLSISLDVVDFEYLQVKLIFLEANGENTLITSDMIHLYHLQQQD